MWVYPSSPDLHFLVCKMGSGGTVYTIGQNALSRPGTEFFWALGRQLPCAERADGRPAPPSSLELRPHSQPPTQSAGKSHIGAAPGWKQVCCMPLELTGPSLHCPGVAQNVCSRGHAPYSPIPPWEGVKGPHAHGYHISCPSKATTGLSVQDGDEPLGASEQVDSCPCYPAPATVEGSPCPSWILPPVDLEV